MTNPTRPIPATPGAGDRTSTYPLEQLLLLWGRGDLTETQMVGHLLQHIMSHDKRIHHLEQPGVTAASRGSLPLQP